MNDIKKNLDEIFYILFKVAKSKNKNKLNFKNVKKWDSLSHVKLILLIESKFKLNKIEPRDSLNLLSYKEILNFVIKKIK